MDGDTALIPLLKPESWGRPALLGPRRDREESQMDKCPSAGNWLNKLCSSHNGICVAVRGNDQELLAPGRQGVCDTLVRG